MRKLQGWPLAIIAALVLFMGMTIAFVRKAFSERVDLVSKDYYYKDKEFSARLEKEKNLLRHGEPQIERTPGGIQVHLPAYFEGKQTGGKVYFYSPLNPAEDFELPFNATGRVAQIAARLKPGQKWKVILDFSTGAEKFYFSQAVW